MKTNFNNIIKLAITLTISMSFFSNAFAAGPNYPAPESGFKKIKISTLSTYPKGSLFTIKFRIATKEGCNSSTHFTTDFEEKTLEGWGYSYYVMKNVKGPVTHGRAGCVYRGISHSFTIRLKQKYYKGNYKQVFYVPEDVTVSYRVWVPTKEILIN